MTPQLADYLLNALPNERQHWLQDQITLNKVLANLLGWQYNRPLCQYVEARIAGRPSPYPRRQRRVNGPVRKYRIA